MNPYDDGIGLDEFGRTGLTPQLAGPVARSSDADYGEWLRPDFMRALPDRRHASLLPHA